MSFRIVLPVDGSTYARWAGEMVCRRLARTGPVEVSLVHVATPLPPAQARRVDRDVVGRFRAEQAARMFAPFRRMMLATSVPHTLHPLVGTPGVEIARQARVDRADLIVMGARGVGAMHELAFGSTLQRVLAETAVPVIALRKPPPRRRMRRVLVAVDGGSPGRHALGAFVRLRGLLGEAVGVDVAHVARRVSLREALAFGLGSRDRHYAEESATVLRPALATLAAAGVDAEPVAAVGEAGETIASLAAARRADLVVIGTHGRGGAKRLVLGSVSREVLARCDVPVMIVR